MIPDFCHELVAAFLASTSANSSEKLMWRARAVWWKLTTSTLRWLRLTPPTKSCERRLHRGE